MNQKNLKLLYEVSSNARITTKQLGKSIKVSQQSASYMRGKLKSNRLINGYSTIFDPVKFGYTNLLVGFEYQEFNFKTKKEILNHLKITDSIINIQECIQGVDLIVEYCVKNLSAFNKIHSDLMYRFRGLLRSRFVHPIIVKHMYPRNYLVRKNDMTEKIICGDRDVTDLTESQIKVCREFQNDPVATFTSMAKSTGLSVKSIINIKKRLEKMAIMRGYSCFFNYPKVDIKRKLLFIRLSSEGIAEMGKITEFAKINRNCVELVKTIGEFHLMIVIEEVNPSNIINDLRSTFPIDSYLLIEVSNIVKESFLPTLNDE